MITKTTLITDIYVKKEAMILLINQAIKGL